MSFCYSLQIELEFLQKKKKRETHFAFMPGTFVKIFEKFLLFRWLYFWLFYLIVFIYTQKLKKKCIRKLIKNV